MNFEFPIKNFSKRAKKLKWFVTRISTKSGFYCEGCLKLIPYVADGLSLVAIVDRKASKNIMDHCSGRVLPCCIPCGIKYNIIKQKNIDSLTEEFLIDCEQAWENELNEIDTFCKISNEIVKKHFQS